ncbi:MAG TPA: SpaA isopeptide-forming pilin-related protein, partial [Beutenbergiaceae bacterium]|nr:SpaA isopeptide-forming pilin-related protein [Beutenbergiaceae bacterium]
MTTTIKRSRVLPRVGAALALMAGSTVGLAVVASADTDLDFGNIDADAEGSITVHKMVPDVDIEPGSPDGSEAANGEGLPDVEFTIYHLDDIDLTDPAGWDDLDAYVDNGLTCPPADGTQIDSAITDGDGQVVFDDLDVGAYVICETDTPPGVVESA